MMTQRAQWHEFDLYFVQQSQKVQHNTKSGQITKFNSAIACKAFYVWEQATSYKHLRSHFPTFPPGDLGMSS
jgi:hypothetical protein